VLFAARLIEPGAASGGHFAEMHSYRSSDARCHARETAAEPVAKKIPALEGREGIR
jgi:hypothetical protein